MMIDILRNNNDPFARYKMPKLILTYEGKANNTRSVLTNLNDIASSLKRSPIMLIKYLSSEKGTNYEYKNQKFSIKGMYKQNELQDMIYNFIDSYVLCSECDNPETFYVQNKVIHIRCYACGSSNPIVKNKMYNIIEKEMANTSTENRSYDVKDDDQKIDFDLNGLYDNNQLLNNDELKKIVDTMDVTKLDVIKEHLKTDDHKVLVSIIKQCCVKMNKYEMIGEYFKYMLENIVCDKDECINLFLAKDKKLTKDENSKIKNVVKTFSKK